MMLLGPKNSTGSGARTWDQLSSLYDVKRGSDPVYTSCTRYVAMKVQNEASLCLDAGCGTGLSTAILSARCKAVVAVDFSLESLKALKRKNLGNVSAVCADLTALPFVDSAFEASACANTLQHFKPDGCQENAITELNRVTRNDGIISISVHHYSRNKRKARWCKEGKPGGASGVDYIFRFTYKDLIALLPRARVYGIGYYELCRIPLIGSRLQNIAAIIFGNLAGRLGVGHMLAAVWRVRDLSSMGND